MNNDKINLMPNGRLNANHGSIPKKRQETFEMHIPGDEQDDQEQDEIMPAKSNNLQTSPAPDANQPPNIQTQKSFWQKIINIFKTKK